MLPVLSQASWVELYQHGTFDKDPNSFYGFGAAEISEDTLDYKKMAMDFALQDLGAQLYAEVKSESMSHLREHSDELQSDFSQSLLVVSNLPIFGHRKIREFQEPATYYVLVKLDPDVANPLYRQKAEAMAFEADRLFKDADGAATVAQKEQRYERAEAAYANYEKLAMIATLLGAKNIKPPVVRAGRIAEALDALYAQKAQKRHKIERIVEQINEVAKQYVTAPSLSESIGKLRTGEKLLLEYGKLSAELGETDLPRPGFTLTHVQMELTHLDEEKAALTERIKTLEARMALEHDRAREAKSVSQKEAALASLQSYAKEHKTLSRQLGKMTQNVDAMRLIEQQMASFKHMEAADVDELAALLARRLDLDTLKGPLALYAPTYEHTDAYTSFSSELQDSLQSVLSQKGRKLKTGSPNRLAGSYFVKPDRVKVNAALYDGDGSVVSAASAVMKIDDPARFRPKENTYATLYATVPDKSMTVQARMNGRADNLLFSGGEKISLEVKVSQEAYIYIVANMRTKAGKQIQYLLPVSNAYGEGQYQLYIPARSANRWISIFDNYTVCPPYGVETLQVFAASKNVLGELPRTVRANIDGEPYYGVLADASGNVLDADMAVAKMRGLKNGGNGKAVKLGESIVRYSTASPLDAAVQRSVEQMCKDY